MAQLEEVKVSVRIKLAALWTTVMFCYIYGDYFELYVPNKAQGLIDGHNLLNSPIKIFAASVLLTIPALMISLSVLLKQNLNRILNIVFGLFYTALMLLIAFTSFEPWRIFYIFLALVESTLTLVIVWKAWSWPQAKS
ncbi:MAG: hypothetical protein JST48_10250 [Bacteroidetes bacterium]|nr:hypothetical protein [Bacteroidota bacterium]